MLRFQDLDYGSMPTGVHVPPSFITEAVCLPPGDESNLGRGNSVSGDVSCSCSERPTQGTTLVGPAAGYCFATSRCLQSAHNALCARHAVEQPERTSDLTFKQNIIDHLTSHAIANYGDKQTDEGWMDKWPERKRELLRKPGNMRPNVVKSFVKYESMHKVPTKARLIQGYAEPRTQATLGPSVSRMQKRIVEAFSAMQGPVFITIASGENPITLGAWMTNCMSSGVTHFYERDGKSWDATMNRYLLDAKLDCFRPYLSECELDLIRAGFSVRGSVRCKMDRLRYRIRNTTKSGHNDTTIGNSVINCLIAYEACMRMGLSAHILVAGDDLLIGIVGDFDEHELAKHEASLGIIPEYRKFDNPLDVTFISARWYPTSSGYAFLPLIGRLLKRLFWTVKSVGHRNRRAYNRAIVLGTKATCGGLPVVRQLLDSMNIDTVKTFDLGNHFKYKLHEYAEIDEEVICHLYGLSIVELHEIYDILERAAGRSCIIKHPAIDVLLAHDLCDIVDRPVH